MNASPYRASAAPEVEDGLYEVVTAVFVYQGLPIALRGWLSVIEGRPALQVGDMLHDNEGRRWKVANIDPPSRGEPGRVLLYGGVNDHIGPAGCYLFRGR